MYLPPQFDRSRDDAAIDAILTGHPFASLISVDEEGLPFVTHLPLHLRATLDTNQRRVLLGHVAKPNPHWRYLKTRPQALAVFLGPHAYMSPSVYPDAQRVPTWNYLAVHCVVQARIVEEAAEKDALLKKLIGDHEPAYAAQWRGLPADYTAKMLNGIVAFELEVTALQCKVKLNQHRPEAHAAMHAQGQGGDDNARGLVQWMERLGLAVPADGAERVGD